MVCRQRSILYHFILSEGLSGRGDTLESQPQVSWRDIRSVVQTASWEVGLVLTNKARIGTLGSSLVRLTKQFWTWRGLLNRCPVAIMMLVLEQWQKTAVVLNKGATISTRAICAAISLSPSTIFLHTIPLINMIRQLQRDISSFYQDSIDIEVLVNLGNAFLCSLE